MKALKTLGLALSLVSTAHATPTFVQINSATPQSPQTSVRVAYNSAQSGGDLNVVVAGWNDSSAAISSVTDSKGNLYQLAIGPTIVSGALTQSIYYAKNIAATPAKTNTLTVLFNKGAVYADIRIAEYSGLDPASPFDVAVGTIGTAVSNNSGSVMTKNANDLLIGANMVRTTTKSAGTGYTKRIITSPDDDLVEDRVVTATGSYNATATVNSSGNWIMQMVAFKASFTGSVGFFVCGPVFF